jgi:hypothetical protein
MTKEKLLDRITRKFGSYNSFARAAHIDPYDFQKFQQRANVTEEELAKMVTLYRDTRPSEDPSVLSDEMRRKIRAKLADYGGVAKFSRDHKISVWTVRRIYSKGEKVSKKALELVYKLGLQW